MIDAHHNFNVLFIRVQQALEMLNMYLFNVKELQNCNVWII